MTAALPSASQAIGEYLQSPDDLAKIPAFKKKLAKEKASIDTRLKNGVREQLQATRDGLKKLLDTRDNVQVIKDEMVAIEKECRQPLIDVPIFDQISRVSRVHRNFESTEEMVINLLEMSTKLEHLEEMLISDSKDILGPAPNLLVIHFQLNQLERFRNQTVHEAKKASADSRAILTKWFDPLNRVIERFDDYIMDLAHNVLSLVRAGNNDVVVRLLKIAEVEGKEDEKAVALRFMKKAARLDAASKFKSVQADARVLKNYRSKILKAISASVKAKFVDAYAPHEKDPLRFLSGLNWLYQDIIRIQADVVPCFPGDYNIYAHYIKEYHTALHDHVQKIASAKHDASLMLSLFDWLKEYKENMKELQIPPELLDPPLLNGNEQSLLDDYLHLLVQKIEEWSRNLMKTETLQFTKREGPPEEDSDGLYGTQGAVILFQMVNQQVDLASESGQGAILARMVSETGRVMRGLQSQWIKIVDAETKKQVDKPEDCPTGLVEYCIALANDQIKSADFSEALLARLEPMVSEKYRVPISESLNGAIDGYLDVAKKCLQTLIDLIFNDLKPATKALFQPSWHERVIRQIVETMRDYMSDYQSYLHPSLLDILVDDLLDAFLLVYLNSLAAAPKLRMPAAVQRMREDISDAFAFFSTLKPGKELEPRFEIMDMILALLEASKDMAFLSYWAFAKVHGPNLAFVDALIRARGDLDRSAANEVMESIKRKVKEEGLTDPPDPTIMKKVVVQNAFSRFLRT